jgi:hypothetical protein
VADPTLVAWIRTHDDAARLLAEHTPDGAGRCPVCHADGASSGRVKAPCALLLAARAAQIPQPRPADGPRAAR